MGKSLSTKLVAISDLFYALTHKLDYEEPNSGPLAGMEDEAYAEHMRRILLMPDIAQNFFEQHEIEKALMHSSFTQSIHESHSLQQDRIFGIVPVIALVAFAAAPSIPLILAAAITTAAFGIKLNKGAQELKKASTLEFHHLLFLANHEFDGSYRKKTRDITPVIRGKRLGHMRVIENKPQSHPDTP